MTGSFGFGAAGSSPPDIRVQDHGTLYLLFPASPAGDQWLREPPRLMRLGGAARSSSSLGTSVIIAAAQADGLEVA